MNFKDFLAENDHDSLKKLGLNPSQFSINDKPSPWLGNPDQAFDSGFLNPKVANNASEEQIEKYSKLYSKSMNTNQLPIYRAISVNIENDYPIIDWENIGVFWSMVKTEARPEGKGVEFNLDMSKDVVDVLLEGLVNPRKIDWEYSFMNFSEWQPSQYEVTLYAGTPLIINKISIFKENGENLSYNNLNINANSGSKGMGSWNKERESKILKLRSNR